VRAAPASMNGLFPIIRRKRRPLVVSDDPPADVSSISTTKEILKDNHQPGTAMQVATTPVKPNQTNTNDVENISETKSG